MAVILFMKVADLTIRMNLSRQIKLYFFLSFFYFFDFFSIIKSLQKNIKRNFFFRTDENVSGKKEIASSI